MSVSQSPAPAALYPTIFVIFGVTGDLAGRKLIPALIGLYSKKLLPPRFAVIGFSRRQFSREDFREFIRSHLNVRPGQFKEEDIKHFLDHMSYEQGFFDDPAAYVRLAARLKEIDGEWGQCSNKLFHLSVPPNLYEGILNRLSGSGLAEPCSAVSTDAEPSEAGWTRVLIEKPFGNDIAHARRLDKLLGRLFKEEQIFRIDHYIAKETLQNIVAFRFANSIFEPIWRREFIEKIHIKLFETYGMEGRGAFYDPIGALKDVGQNHILSMLAVVAMDRPGEFTGPSVARERARVLGKLARVSPRHVGEQVVRGQYAGYTGEAGVKNDSTTETYFRIRCFIDSSRWRGVPIWLENGKALAEAKTEIDVYFKSSKFKVQSSKFGTKTNAGANSDGQNILTFRIQPDEGIRLKFFVKTPGSEFKLEPKPLRFKYADSMPLPDASNDYERLIHDAFIGDQTLFASTDEIMASWRFVTSILENWGKLPLVKYPRGAKQVG